MSDINQEKDKNSRKLKKENEVKEVKDADEDFSSESDNEGDAIKETQLKEENAKKLKELETTLANVEARIKKLKSDPSSPSVDKQLEAFTKMRRVLLITREKLTEKKKSSIWDSIVIILLLVLFCGFLVLSKLNEEYYSNFNWGDGRNLYDILDIPESSSKEQIKKRYRELVTKYHPDKNPGCDECPQKYLDIQHAYEVLVDEDQRALYNETNGFGNFLKSAATDLTIQNYTDQVKNSKNVWIIMVYKNNNYPSEFFSGFWEDVLKSYPFLKFGRINYKTQAKLIRKLPFKIREFPVVFATSNFMEPVLMEISLRGNVEKGLRQFILESVSENLNEVKSVSDITADQYVYIEIHKSDYPLIISNYHAKIFRERFGINFYFHHTEKRTQKMISTKNQSGTIEFFYDDLKSTFSKIYDYLMVQTVKDFNRDNYHRFCKNRENYCLVIVENKLPLLQYMIDESTDKAVNCLRNQFGCDSSKLLTILSVDPLKQPKLVKSDNIDFNIEGLLFKNSAKVYKVETLLMLDGIAELTSIPYNSFTELKHFKADGYNFDELIRPEVFSAPKEYLSDYINLFFSFNIGFFSLLIGYFLLRKIKISNFIAILILTGVSVAVSVKMTSDRL